VNTSLRGFYSAIWSRTSKDRRDFIWSLVGNGSQAAAQWGVLFLLVRVESPAIVGEYGLAIGLATPFMLLADLQLRTLQGTDFKKAFDFADYMALRWAALVFAIAALTIVLNFSNYGMQVKIMALLFALRLAISAVTDVYYGLFLQHGRIDILGQAAAITQFCIFTSFSFGLLVTGNLLFAMAGAALAVLASLLAFTSRRAKLLPPFQVERPVRLVRWKLPVQVELFKTAFPLGVTLFLISLTANMPRYFLGALGLESELGILVALMSLLTVGSLLSNAIGQSLLPKVTHAYAAGSQEIFTHLVLKCFALGILLTIVAVAFASLLGPFVAGHMFGPEYARRRFVIVCLAMIFGIELLTRIVGIAVTVARLLNVQVLINIASLISSVVLLALLVPAYSLKGATLAILVTALIRLGLLTAVLHRHITAWPKRMSLQRNLNP